MLKRAIISEKIKFKRSPVYLAFAVLTVISAVLGTANYAANIGVLRGGWLSLWTQHTLFACALFIPGELGVLCAWQWRLEHADYCLNRLMTSPVPFACLYLAKLFWAACTSVLVIVLTLLGYLAGGLAVGLPLGDFPPYAAKWALCGVLGCIVICAWQTLLSMLIRPFAVPVAASLVAGFAGLYIAARGAGLYWPWALLSVGMSANKADNTLTLPPFILSCAVMAAIPTITAIIIAQKKDVKAE